MFVYIENSTQATHLIFTIYMIDGFVRKHENDRQQQQKLFSVFELPLAMHYIIKRFMVASEHHQRQ